MIFRSLLTILVKNLISLHIVLSHHISFSSRFTITFLFAVSIAMYLPFCRVLRRTSSACPQQQGTVLLRGDPVSDPPLGRGDEPVAGRSLHLHFGRDRCCRLPSSAARLFDTTSNSLFTGGIHRQLQFCSSMGSIDNFGCRRAGSGQLPAGTNHQHPHCRSICWLHNDLRSTRFGTLHRARVSRHCASRARRKGSKGLKWGGDLDRQTS